MSPPPFARRGRSAASQVHSKPRDRGRFSLGPRSIFDMRRFALLAALAITAASAQPALKDRIRRRITGFSGVVSLYATNLETGLAVGIGESDPVRTASTIKLPIMLAVFDAVARGQAKWTETLAVTPTEKVSGTGVLGSEASDGVQLPLRDVVNLMMVLSDNTATNMIIERVTAEA